MNPAVFDALIDRLDTEIAQGPLPLRKVAAPPPVSREDIGPSRPSTADLVHTAREMRDHAAALAEPTCPPRPPEPPPATSRSWLARLLFRRSR
jgi:hypothetical protein